MLVHYFGVVLPEGYKAQVVATSRRAAVLYHEKLTAARDQLVAELEGVARRDLVAARSGRRTARSAHPLSGAATPACR